MNPDDANQRIAFCASADLQEGARAVPFDVVYAGQTCRAFAVRFEGQPHAYLNRCTHVAWKWTSSPTSFLMTPADGCCALHTARCMRPIPANAQAVHAAAAWSRLTFQKQMAWSTGILPTT
jgi:nitrite reductase/ring-hydroxylating ferredoxin subunit